MRNRQMHQIQVIVGGEAKQNEAIKAGPPTLHTLKLLRKNQRKAQVHQRMKLLSVPSKKAGRKSRKEKREEEAERYKHKEVRLQ
jgi:hypothetical protein